MDEDLWRTAYHDVLQQWLFLVNMHRFSSAINDVKVFWRINTLSDVTNLKAYLQRKNMSQIVGYTVENCCKISAFFRPPPPLHFLYRILYDPFYHHIGMYWAVLRLKTIGIGGIHLTHAFCEILKGKMHFLQSHITSDYHNHDFEED